MKFIKSYEELKYTPEHKRLVARLRYSLNKIFGKNSCGISKVRYLKADQNYSYTSDYAEYTGSTMLFSIYISNGFVDDNKNETRKKFDKIAKEIGLVKEYDTSLSFYGTQEQMEILLDKLKWIIIEVDADRYNI